MDCKDEEIEFNPCGLSSEDLAIYTDLVFELGRENSITGHLEELSRGGYGTSLKEIDLFFRDHLQSCYPCNERHEDELALFRFLANPESAREFWTNKGVPSWRITFREQLGIILNQFGLEHLSMEGEAIKLRTYILDKYRKIKTLRQNPDFDCHIKECVMCRNIEFSARCSYDEDYNPFLD
jgi:hypothetical protein